MQERIDSQYIIQKKFLPRGMCYAVQNLTFHLILKDTAEYALNIRDWNWMGTVEQLYRTADGRRILSVLTHESGAERINERERFNLLLDMHACSKHTKRAELNNVIHYPREY